MTKNCDNCGFLLTEQVIHVCGRNEGRLPLFDGDGNCKGWKKKRITNGDNFRAMTDDELAQYICKTQYRDGDFCPPTHNCELDKSCEKCWLDWLRQECE